MGVSRQTVHRWLRRNAKAGLAGLVDRPPTPKSCPHQMTPEVEAAVVAMRRSHPGWGPRTIGHQLAQAGVVAVPGRSSIYRALVRHGLIDPKARKREAVGYRRWERSRSMELWQMDITGGVVLEDGSKLQVMTDSGVSLKTDMSPPWMHWAWPIVTRDMGTSDRRRTSRGPVASGDFYSGTRGTDGALTGLASGCTCRCVGGGDDRGWAPSDAHGSRGGRGV